MSKPGFQILEAAGAKTLRLSGDTGVDAAKENIRTLAKEFGKVEEGEKLIASIEADLAQVKKKLDALKDEDAPKVMVVYVRPNATMLMGDDANATALAHLAGATSAFPGMMGNKPLNAEAVIGAKPDVVLCYAQGLESVGGIDTLLKQPGIAGTPAGNQRRVVALDDLLIGGFGPRTGKAVLELFHALYETEGEYIPAREK